MSSTHEQYTLAVHRHSRTLDRLQRSGILWCVCTFLVCTPLACTFLVCTPLACTFLVCTPLACTFLVCMPLACTFLVCMPLACTFLCSFLSYYPVQTFSCPNL